MNKKIESKNVCEIAEEWNRVCEKREQTINQGKDISLKYVTVPSIIKNLSEENPKSVLDVGCGTGFLTNEISKICDYCCGIDASAKSIRIAKEKYKKDHVTFQNSTISEFKSQDRFDSCVANMVFMTDPDWINSLKNIYEHLSIGGSLFVMITHPCFWPLYWEYANESWFNYSKEIYIENEFHTSFSESIGITTHIHRPLSIYFENIKLAGFDIEMIEEPMPIKGTPIEYKFEYPRFLMFKCRKRGE